MGRKRRKEPAEKKPKQVTIQKLDRDDKVIEAGEVPHAYRILDYLIEQKHSHLAEAEFAIAYLTSNIREDVDGTVGYGRVKLGTDLDRAYTGYDFVIIIPKGMWQLSDEVRRHAIIDFHLCSCQVVKDKHGEDKIDDDGRTVYRLRKPYKVFPENIGRYGLWQSESVADSVNRYNDSKRPLLPENRKKAAPFNEPANAPAAEADGHAGNGKPKGKKAAKNGQVPPGATSTTTPGGIAEHDAEARSSDAWRNKSIDELDVPEWLNKTLTKAGIWTLGELEDVEHGQGSLRGIAGLTDAGFELLVDAVSKFREQHPELAEATA